MGGLAHEPGVDAVGARLVHGREDEWKVLAKLLFPDDPDGVAQAVGVCHLGGQGSLVAGRAAELLERQGHGLDVLLAGVPHQAGERTGVDPRGEEGTDRHVGD